MVSNYCNCHLHHNKLRINVSRMLTCTFSDHVVHVLSHSVIHYFVTVIYIYILGYALSYLVSETVSTAS